jgi:hypothetical protein
MANLTRRVFLGAIAAAGVAACQAPTATAPTRVPYAADVVLSTDFTVNPSGDPDDAYDLLCAKALGIRRVILDAPEPESVAAVESLGMYAVAPQAIRDAASVMVVGSPTNAAAFFKKGQRVVLFAGDYTGLAEHNQQLDPTAYDHLRAQATTYWVPCFQGGLWQAGPHASYVQTTDAALTDGIPRARDWLQPKFTDRWGTRNLWAGALMRLAFADSWGGNGFDASHTFTAGRDFVTDMTYGTRWLLAQY